MKKVVSDPKSLTKPTKTATQWYISNEELGLPDSEKKSANDVSLAASDYDDAETGDYSGLVGTHSGDFILDDVDGHSGGYMVDIQKTLLAREILQSKIVKVHETIRAEQNTQEDNVTEFVRLSGNPHADKQSLARIKTAFEKKNQKSTQLIVQWQRKLEAYDKRLRDLDAHRALNGPRPAKDVLKEVGQGLKDVGANIRGGISGFSESITSKPKFLATRFMNQFGSADNIAAIDLEEHHHVLREVIHSPKHLHQPNGTTLPASFRYQYHSNEDVSCAAANISTASLQTARLHATPAHSQATPTHSAAGNNAKLAVLIEQAREGHQEQLELHKKLGELQTELEENRSFMVGRLEEQKSRCEHLEEQINDLVELHQHEMFVLKQSLECLEEKMEYQLDERTRDMQDMLETCQSKIGRIEQQYLHQQMIPLDSSKLRTFVVKVVNVFLAILAVILVVVDTCRHIILPFTSSRLRCIVTVVIISVLVAVVKNWSFFSIRFLPDSWTKT